MHTGGFISGGGAFILGHEIHIVGNFFRVAKFSSVLDADIASKLQRNYSHFRIFSNFSIRNDFGNVLTLISLYLIILIDLLWGFIFVRFFKVFRAGFIFG